VGTVGGLQTGVGSVINHGRAACSIILLRSTAGYVLFWEQPQRRAAT